MDGGLLSLKWNNHRSTFFYVLSNVRKKECYTDVTLACDGKFYPVHKLVLSTCSEYFEQMFEQTQCKHPVIVLKDIRSEELESLLSYMYVGEVNVVQEKLSGLIKAAECLRIKGLAVPDEEPLTGNNKPISSSREKRISDNSVSSEPKRRRQEDSSSSSFRQNVSNRNEDRRKSLDYQSSFSSNNKFRNSSSNNVSNNSNPRDTEKSPRDIRPPRSSPSHSTGSNSQPSLEVKAEQQLDQEQLDTSQDDVTIDEQQTEPVKQEPVDLDAVYLSDSNSASDNKDILMDNFGDGDGQQHFMDELLGQNSGSEQGHMGVGDYGEGGEGSSSAPSAGGSQQQQQHMVRALYQHRVGNMLANASSTSQWRVPPELPAGKQLTPAALDASTPVSPTQHISTFRLSDDSNVTPSELSRRFALGWAGTGSSSLLPAATSNSSLFLGSVDTTGQSDECSSVMDATPYHLLDVGRLETINGTFTCPVCCKEIRDRSHFKRHYMIHTGEKPFQCEYCCYRASRREEVSYHTLRKHPDKTF